MAKKHVSSQSVGTALAGVSNNEALTQLNLSITQMQQEIEGLQEAVSACPFKTGMILCFVDSTDPNTLYPGTTWQKIEGKFLLGSSSSYALGATGGSATHTLTIAETPSHDHTLQNHTHSVGAHSHGLNNHTHSFGHNHKLKMNYSSSEGSQYGLAVSNAFGGRVLVGRDNEEYTSGWSSSSTTGGASGSTANSGAFNSGGPSNNYTNKVGSGNAHNNMPPYLTVNMWKRVA